MSNQPVKNQTFVFYMSLVSQSTGQWQANPTLAAGDVKAAIDDDAPANLGTLPVVDADFTKRIKVTLSAAEMNSGNTTLIFSDAAGAEWDDVTINIQPVSWLDTNDDITGLTAAAVTEIQTGLATPTNITAGTITTVTNLTNLPAITSNWLTAAGISAGALNGKGDWNIGKTGYTLSAAGIQAIWDALTSVLTVADSIGKLLVDNINATISSRSSHAAADIWSVATRLLTAGTNIVLAKGVGVTGFNDLSAGDVRAAVGLASADLDAQLDALPTAAENADAMLDEDMTGHQIQGSLGQAIGDPVADTNTIYKAVVTDAAGATVGADTTSALSRLPAALSGDGFMKSDLKSIEDELTSGNNATLKLRQLDLRNTSGIAFRAISDDSHGVQFGSLGEGTAGLNTIATGQESFGILTQGVIAGFYAEGNDGIYAVANVSGKSINAPQDIAVSDGNLTLAAIANAVWTNVTRTLTAIADSAGVTTLLSRIGGALNIAGGKVESNVKQINDTDVTGDGSTTPWGPA